MSESCTITRKSASNLALAFILLPPEKRAGMAALYAFCREVDDVADEETVPVEQRRARLTAWREDVRRACGAEQPQFAVNRELQPVIQRYRLPFNLFDELLEGVEMDLSIPRYETFEALERYCYRVASVVGLLSIEIFGYTDPACRQYACALGQALQLTNILRDVGNDAQRGRIYIPQSELARCGVLEQEIFHSEYSPRFVEAAKGVAHRAKGFYRQAAKTLPVADRKSMLAAEMMGAVYWQLLRKLEKRQFNVLGSHIVKLSKPRKLALAFTTWCALRLSRQGSPYGD